MTEDARLKKKKAKQEEYYGLKVHGICTSCRKEKAIEGKTYCEKCQIKANARGRARYHKEVEKQYERGPSFYKPKDLDKKIIEAWDFGNRTFAEVAAITGASMSRIKYLLPTGRQG